MQLNESTKGLGASIFAFVLWGLLPIYWKALNTISAQEIICHRIIWSFVFAGGLLVFSRRMGEVRQAFSSFRHFGQMMVSGFLIGSNWLIFIWGVNAGYIVECSLGYYINPLVNVVLGFMVFRDRLRPVQWLAIAFAVIGVLNQVIQFGKLPWIALFLAFSFALYGLTRKMMRLGPISGLFVETAILSVPASFFLISFMSRGQSALGTQGMDINMLLIGCGAVTSIPLILFAYGARRLKLATLGLLQYIGPTGMLLLGIYMYDEPFGTATLITFSLIWVGVILYSVESWLYIRQQVIVGTDLG